MLWENGNVLFWGWGFFGTFWGEALDGQGVESRWTLYFITFSSCQCVWWHMHYESSIILCIFFVQDECKQIDNTPHWLGLHSKKPPKAGVAISMQVVVVSNRGESSCEGGGLLQGVGCDLLHQLLIPLYAKQDAKAGRVASFLHGEGQSNWGIIVLYGSLALTVVSPSVV